MHVLVVANGELLRADAPSLSEVIATADMVIAADGGLLHCDALHRTPDLLVGDLDSVGTDRVERARTDGVRIAQYPTDKDATDLELALDAALEAGATAITVLAAFGGRLDHSLATTGLLTSNRWAALAVAAMDGRRRLWVVRNRLELRLQLGATLSLIPWAGEVQGVTTEGLQWPLANDVLPLGSTRGVSNIAAEPQQRVSISSGVLLAVTDIEGASARSDS